MSVRSGQSITVEFTTRAFATGAATDATGTPTGTIYVNGTADAASVTVTNQATGRYKAAVTLPTLAVGDVVSLLITATVSGVTDTDKVWEDTKDLVIDSAGLVDANAVKLGPSGSGTAQTARDIGASVLLSSGTGTGQVKLSGGYVAPNWGDVGNPTTTVGLSGTTVKTATDVETDTADIQSRLPTSLSNGRMKSDTEALGGATDGIANLNDLGAQGYDPALHRVLRVASTDSAEALGTQAKADVNGECDTALTDYGALKPTDAGRTLDVSADGGAGLDWSNIHSPTSTVNLSGTTIATTQQVDLNTIKTQAVTCAAGVTVLASVGTAAASTAQTGDAYARLGAPAGASVSADVAAVKTDTGNLVTRIPSALFSGITSLAQWLGLIAGKQVGNTTARTEINATGAGSGTFDETTDSVQAIRDRGDAAWTTGSGGGLDAAGVRSALGMASANLDTQLGAIDDFLDTEVAAIKAKTDNLPADPADASDIAASFSSVASTLSTIAGYLDTEVAAILAAVDTEVGAIKAKTDNLPASPAATGDAMTLTSGERTAIANEVEAQIIDDTDSEKVLQAIIDKIAAANPSLDDLTLGAIASAVRTELAVELARIDAAITTRLATASYTAPPSAATNASAVRTELTTELGRIDAAITTRATPAQVATELATYDGPTNAEFEARTLPSASYAEPGDAMTLADSEDVYPADIGFTIDDTNARDEYTVQWFRNGTPVTSGVTVPTIQAIKRANGTDLIPSSVMTQIGSTGAYKYDASTTERTTAGEAVVVVASATINGATRTWRKVITRDVETA